MSTPNVNWLNIPEELRARPQWAVASPEKMPLMVVDNQLVNAHVDGYEFMTFEQAASIAYRKGLHIGYIITDRDPYCCIDLDVKAHTTQEEMDYYLQLVKVYDSYSEFSRSGQGMHIWARGNIGKGCRFGGLEVYSQRRFIISTGNVYNPKPIEDRQELLEKLAIRIRANQAASNFTLEEQEAVYDDQEILERASYAENGDKFLALCRGEWQEMGFPSQSEADLALMSMFTFYSESNEQCRRLFRMTALGQRKKAERNQYLDYMIGLKRGQQLEQKELQATIERQAREFAERVSAPARAQDYYEQAVALTPERILQAKQAIAEMQSHHEEEPQHNQLSVALAKQEFEESELYQEAAGLDWPPGFAGVIASFIYQASPRPVREVSIVATLGFLAGLFGKRYNISGTGLNCYIILVAKSGVGKEAMHSGISTIMRDCANPVLNQRISFTEFASGPALMKACEANHCFVNVLGEFGRKLVRMANDGTEGPMHTLRTAMTNLYQKSGHKSIVGGLGYSTQEKDVSSVHGIAYSMIGETTPNTFYESLTASMMEDGFMSRFNIVHYEGRRPEFNEKHLTKTPSIIIQAINNYTGDVVTDAARSLEAPQDVQVDDWSKKAFDTFNLECDRNINSTEDESYRQMWNRAHLKVMRLAALLAVADNNLFPVVKKEHTLWALALVRKDISRMSDRIQSGDVGSGDESREKLLGKMILKYIQEGPGYTHIRKVDLLHQSGLIPRSWLQTLAANRSSFRAHKMGYNRALDLTIKSFIDSGYLVEADQRVLTSLGYTGKAYRVMDLPNVG